MCCLLLKNSVAMINIDIKDVHYKVKMAALNALYEVIDPELAINIVDLGLVYDIAVEGKDIVVSMTLSTPSCPMGGIISAHAKVAVSQACPGYDAEVQLVWEPRWNADDTSEAAKVALGW
jgi:metal-sulfur cluster biosynthetic enzyme